MTGKSHTHSRDQHVIIGGTGRIIRGALHATGRTTSGDSVGGGSTAGLAEESLRDIVHRMENRQVATTWTLARIDSTIRQMEAGVQNIIGQGQGWVRY